jgi:hypothetical protein
VEISPIVPKDLLRISPFPSPMLVRKNAVVKSSISMEAISAEDSARKRARSQEPESLSNDAGLSPMRQMYARDNRGPALPKRVACTHCRQSKVCLTPFSDGFSMFRIME